MKSKLFLCLAVATTLSANSFNAEMTTYLNKLRMDAKKNDSTFVDFDVSRGKEIFTSKHIGQKGQLISCESCHNSDLTKIGKNTFTNKLIDPLSPKTNKERLSTVKDVEKWLRRNFNDVYSKEGTSKQKGDVLYYINSK